MQEKSQRQLQVGEQIKRIIADLFAKEDLFNSKDSYVTVAQADVSPDMKNVKIIINIFGSADRKKLTAELNKASAYFRSKLASKIAMRTVPELLFVLDDVGAEARKTLDILEQEAKRFNSNN